MDDPSPGSPTVRGDTNELMGLFLRPAVADSPPSVYLLRRTDLPAYGPFLTHWTQGRTVSRTATLARVIRDQVYNSPGLQGLEVQFRNPHISQVLAYVDLPSASDPTKKDLLVVQTGDLPQVQAPGHADPTSHFLFLSSTIFDEAHRSARAALAAHAITPTHESLKVDRLVSVPIQNLLKLALPRNTRPGVLTVADKRGEAVPLHPLFTAALTDDRVVAALRAGEAHLARTGVLPVAHGAGEAAPDARPPSPVHARRGAAAMPAPLVDPRVLRFQEAGDMDLIVERPARGDPIKRFRLFVGSFGAAHDWETLRANGVSHVVNCAAADLTPHIGNFHLELHGLPAAATGRCCNGVSLTNYQAHPPDLAKPTHWAPFANQGIEYAVVYAQENGSPCQDISVGWPGAFALLRDCWREGGTALVHCKAGLNRSVTTAAVFLLMHGVFRTWEEAIAAIRVARPVVAVGNEDEMGRRLAAPHPHWWEYFGRPFVEAEFEKERYKAWRKAGAGPGVSQSTK